eukprot:UN12516
MTYFLSYFSRFLQNSNVPKFKLLKAKGLSIPIIVKLIFLRKLQT